MMYKDEQWQDLWQDNVRVFVDCLYTAPLYFTSGHSCSACSFRRPWM